MLKKYKEMNEFLIDQFETHVLNNPNKTMVIYEDNAFTYEFINQQANRVANGMRALGIKYGDTVALMIHNEPAFIWTFLGNFVFFF